MISRANIVVISWTALALAAFPAVLMLPGQLATQLVAALGLFISAGSAAYNVYYKERERAAKEAEKRDHVTAEISYNPDEREMEVRVFNPSHSKVIALEAVQLICVVGKDEFTRWLRIDSGLESIDLEARHSALFTAPYDIGEFEHISTLPPDKVWISIRSHEGEIERVKGEKVIPILGRMVADILHKAPYVPD